MCTMDSPLTVTTPRRQSVDSGPSRNMKRRITEPINVRMPDSRGSVITITKENINMAQNSREICELSSESQKKELCVK